MEKFPKYEEICKIIVTCRKAGVSSLKLGDLEVVFGSVTNDTKQPDPFSLPQVPQSGASPTPEAQVPGQTIQAQQRLEEDNHEEQGIQAREEQIAELMVTDPLLAEELMERGELEPIGESTDGSSEQIEALSI